MVNWQVTAATIHCDAVDDEVTILVYKDWSVKCTGYRKYGESNREAAKLLREKSRQIQQRLTCEGPECYRAIQYKEKLLSEEAKSGR